MHIQSLHPRSQIPAKSKTKSKHCTKNYKLRDQPSQTRGLRRYRFLNFGLNDYRQRISSSPPLPPFFTHTHLSLPPPPSHPHIHTRSLTHSINLASSINSSFSSINSTFILTKYRVLTDKLDPFPPYKIEFILRLRG